LLKLRSISTSAHSAADYDDDQQNDLSNIA